MMPDTFNPNPSQTQAQSQDQTPVAGEAFDDSIGVQGAAVTDQVSPDTGIAGAADSSPGTSEEIQRDAASVISREAGHVTGTPDEARQTDEQRAEAEDDPLSRDTGGVFEGKRVFKANELNQSGEDKEYFHPQEGHQFKVPPDAQHHALTPDVALTPGTKPAVELKTDKL